MDDHPTLTPYQALLEIQNALERHKPDEAAHIVRLALRRHSVLEALVTHQHDGKVLIIESGRDCDCVEYSGRQHRIEASLEAYNELDDRIGEGADGPYELEIVPFHSKVDWTTHDLVMEAREDGHPHSISSRFP